MTIHERTVGSLKEDEAFSLDGGETWYSCAVNCSHVLGYVAVAYWGSRRDTIRLPIDGVDQPCLVNDELHCADCGRRVHLHPVSTTGYQHCPDPKPGRAPCVVKPPSYVLNVAGDRMP